MEFVYTRKEVIEYVRNYGQKINYDKFECYWLPEKALFSNMLLMKADENDLKKGVHLSHISYLCERIFFDFSLIRMDLFEELFLLETDYLITKQMIEPVYKVMKNLNALAERYSGLCKKCIVPGNIKLEEHLIFLIKEYDKILNC